MYFLWFFFVKNYYIFIIKYLLKIFIILFLINFKNMFFF